MSPRRDQKTLHLFGDHLRELRERKGFSLRQLADEAEVDFSTIHRVEKGIINPTLLLLLALARALDLTLLQLLDFQ